jgi:hypothetical protein
MFMPFGYIAHKDFGYPVYALWLYCSQRFWLSCLGPLVILLTKILGVLFRPFVYIAHKDFGCPG